MGADPAERRGGAGRRHHPRQSFRQPDHDRPRRHPPSAVPIRLRPLPRRLRLRRRRQRREHHRSRLGRPGHGVRERRSPRGGRPFSRSGADGGGRHRSRPAAAGADADGHLRRQPPHPRWPCRHLPPRGVPARPAARATSAWSVASSGSRSCRPIPRGCEQDCYEAYNIQVVRPRAAASRHRHEARRDRRLRRARLHPRADRRRPCAGPTEAAAREHPGVHPARLRHQRPHQGQRLAPDEQHRRHCARTRYPPRRDPDARRPRPRVRTRRETVRHHVRERTGRIADRLPVPARQPERRLRARHRRPIGTGPRLVHLRRGRPDVALQRQLRACPRR